LVIFSKVFIDLNGEQKYVGTKEKITLNIFIQGFENNKGAEKVEVNYEILKNPKKMFRPQ
jgi:hypothetical protein